MAMKKNASTISIHNLKTPLYRQVHVDGVHGGITPNGLININFFNQRAAIPKGTEFEIDDNGQLTRPIKNIENSKNGIVREFEFGAYMDIHTCISIKEFLEKKIEEYNSIINAK
jgi:hypothetical protein